MQYAWNKYGENNFKFSVLKHCSIDELDSREVYYIVLYDTYKNGYNRDKGGQCNRDVPEEIRQAISDTKSQPIIQLNLNGDFIKEWKSAREVCIKLGYRQEALCLNLCCISKSYDNYIWVYKDIYNSEKFDIKKYYRENNLDGKSKQVVQCNLKNEYIKTWNSIGDASRYYGVDRRKIGNACNINSKYKVVNNSYWYYLEDYLTGYRHIDNVKHKKCSNNRFTVPIDQYDLDENFIQHFDSIKEAGMLLNISTDMISRVCRQVRKQTHGYIFKYSR